LRQSLIGPWPGGGRMPVPGFTLGDGQAAWAMAAVLAALIVGVPVVLNLITSQPPSPLEWFALGCTALVVAMYLWPGQLPHDFAAFLAPFLGLAIALPCSRLLTLRLTMRPLRGPPPPHPVRAAATAGSVLILALLAFTQARSESRQPPVAAPSATAHFQHDVTVISADRFGDTRPGRVSPGTGRDRHARRG
jgi:hypothetical protein